jgi:FRG domain
LLVFEEKAMSDNPVAAPSEASTGQEASTDQAILSFIKKALKAQESLSASADKTLWYRGQADETWDLMPGLFRSTKARSLEGDAYKEWVRRADLIEKHEDKEWYHLFNMQHYGVPTRLLDWTESFAMAVGFCLAFSDNARKSVPRIFILDPIALNIETTGRDRIFEIPEDETLSYRQTYLENKGIMPRGPVAVKPSSYKLNNRRADNQAGVFTLHANDTMPLNKQFKKTVTSFTIDQSDIPGAKLFLKLSNVNPYTIYPDFGGLAGYIRAMLSGEMK